MAMKQVGKDNVHIQREIAKAVAIEKVKFDGKPHAFSYPADGKSGSEKRKWVEARNVGPGIITKGQDYE